MSSIAITAYRNRTRDYSIALFDGSGADFNLTVDDIVIIKIGRGNGADPDLELSSDNDPSAGGSTVEFTPGTNDINLHLARLDTKEMEPGVYDLEVNVVDGDELRLASIGEFVLIGTLAGEEIEHSSG